MSKTIGVDERKIHKLGLKVIEASDKLGCSYVELFVMCERMIELLESEGAVFVVGSPDRNDLN